MILWHRVKEEEERARSRTATRKRVSMELSVYVCVKRYLWLVLVGYIIEAKGGTKRM